MLIEFSVSNFRSFRERQTFSMVAAPKLRSKGNLFRPKVAGEKLPDLLRVAAIYGPNASGKSNLLRALKVVLRIANQSPGSAGFLPVAPFRFDKDLIPKPSCFDLHFLAGNMRYQFELEATPERIIKEKLTAYPKGKEVIFYERIYSKDDGEQYNFSKDLEGGVDIHSAWRKLTGPRTLFIAQAAANSSEELTQLRIPFGWLSGGVLVVEDGMDGLAETAKNLIKGGGTHAEDVAAFLQEVDVPVTSIRVDPLPNPVDTSKILEPLLSAIPSFANPKNKTTFTHTTALGDAEFDFEEESDGTKGLFGFWLPWSIMDFEERPFDVIAVDELDSSLHPEIVANLVEKFLAFTIPSQLLFSTHDTHLMDTKLLRRDQFWVTERDANGATKIRSIHEFDGREGEDIEKRYYEGRYRGLPVVRKD